MPSDHLGSGAAISLATADDAPDLGRLIAEAFAGMNATEWLFGNDMAGCLRVLTAQFAMFVVHAVKCGSAYTAADGDAVAVWFDNTRGYPWIDDYDRRLREIAGGHYQRVAALEAAFAEHHPHGPHHHLALLAVRPGRQGRGLGSALLEVHHRQLDADGIPAFLETSTLNARALYERHGYQRREPYNLPDGGPAFHPMWRQPR